MKYNVLPQKDTESSNSDDSFEATQTRPPQRRVSISTIILVVLSSTTLITSFCLLSLLTTRQNSLCPVQDNGRNVVRPYGRENSSRMSVEHGHDHLWDAFSEKKPFGFISKDDPDTAGMISMCVSQSSGLNLITDVDNARRFHQMNCLSLLRTEIQSARAGLDTDHTGGGTLHWSHCFDYLYQVMKPIC